MKEKFEAAIRDKCRERLGRNNVVGIIEAAERCDTLHQQALKNILKSLKESCLTNDLATVYDDIKNIAKQNHIDLWKH